MQETQETQVQSLSWEVSLKKEMATHSSILAWEIPWTEEPGWLQSTGLQRVRHDLTTTHTHIPVINQVGTTISMARARATPQTTETIAWYQRQKFHLYSRELFSSIWESPSAHGILSTFCIIFQKTWIVKLHNNKTSKLQQHIYLKKKMEWYKD